MEINTVDVTLVEMAEVVLSTRNLLEADGFAPIFVVHCNQRIGCRRVLRDRMENCSVEIGLDGNDQKQKSSEPCSQVVDLRGTPTKDQASRIKDELTGKNVQIVLLRPDEFPVIEVLEHKPIVRLKAMADLQEWISSVAVCNGIDARISTFLHLNPELFDAYSICQNRGEVVAATPIGWEQASRVLRKCADQSHQRILLAGLLGSHATGQFFEFSDRVSETVCVETLLKAKGTKRKALYPRSTEALTFLTYRLIDLFDADHARDVIAALSELGSLNRSIHGGGNSQVWLSDLVACTFEHLLAKGRREGVEQVFLDHPAYARFMSDHRLSLRQNREPEPNRTD